MSSLYVHGIRPNIGQYIRVLFAAVVLAVGANSFGDDGPETSEIAADEHVQFFRSAAWLDEKGQFWNVPIHGWIYEPEDSVARKALLSTILEAEFDLVVTDESRANFERRLNLLIADNERGKQIVIEIGDQSYALPASAENGHFASTVRIPVADVNAMARDSELRYTAVTDEDEHRAFEGAVNLIGPAGLSVISDIDDTVKISNVTERRKLLEQTFLLDFSAAPGMAELYSRWAATGISFHFVSSSPWQLYAPLAEFLDRSGFPPATLNLKPVRFRDETLFDLFKKGTETKPAVIEGILRSYPHREFILVGDSGEQDPEVYAELLRKYPDQVLSAYIRNVTGEAPDGPRFTAVFDGIDSERWQLFDDPMSIASDPK